jgi:hypothetical protein
MTARTRYSVFVALALSLSYGLAANAGAYQDTASDRAKPAEPVDAAPEVHSVSVSAVKDPEMKSYRAMLAGLDAFEQHHALAPEAPQLRFVLSSVSGESGVDFEHTKLSIRGDNVTIPLVLDAAFVNVVVASSQAACFNASGRIRSGFNQT